MFISLGAKEVEMEKKDNTFNYLNAIIILITYTM